MKSEEILESGKVFNKTKIVVWMLLGIFWIMSTYNFILQETMPALHAKVASYFLLFGDVSIACLGLWLMRDKYDIIFFSSFILITFVSARINGNSLIFWANGLRHYTAFLFVLPIIRYLLATKPRLKYFIAVFDKNLYAFLWLQVPCMIYQCILYGAYDNVGGSLGWMMSPVISTLIYIISFYFLIKKWDFNLNLTQNLKNNWILIFLLFPSYLNETKISFIFLALYFLLMIPMYKQFARMVIVVIPIIAVALTAVGYLYMSIVDTHGDDVFSREYIEYYLYGDDDAQEYIMEYFLEREEVDYDEGDIARGIKFLILPTLMDEDNSWLLGHGIGQFKGGTQLEQSKFAKHYDWLLQGTVMHGFQWLIETGIIGCIWIVCYYLYLFRIFTKRRKRELRIQWYVGIITILLIPYANNFLFIPFSIIYTYIVFLSAHWRRMPNVQFQYPIEYSLMKYEKENKANDTSIKEITQ